MTRTARVSRTSKETDIHISLDLDSPEPGTIATGHGFLDHMLEQITRHGKLKLDVEAKGDLHIDVHHLAEDTGIVLGQTLAQALGDRVGLERYADSFVPMDETLAHVVLDLSGRPFIAFEPQGYEGDSNGFTVHHLREFLRGFANHAGATLHVSVLSGTETHHVCEAIVKAFARSLFTATRITSDSLPSTKGLL
ncbi:MAG: imidazoleglycerol-phosphate dehydratase HisB [Trueperaceae bacterium]|nr:imidazoleglycerol-phosphate dehydratase HisB [Trueperaceae bacterium]